jgi:hypothetical protein
MIATSPLDRFRAAVLADAQAQAFLAEPEEAAAFEARALRWAAGEGIALAGGDLAPPRDPTPRFMPDWPPPGWLPFRFLADPEPRLDWLHFAGKSPNQPFFEDAVRQVSGRPFNQLFRVATPVTQPPEPLKAPSGLIFHMSRCGSTLVSQMLGAAAGHVAISEAPPIDALLQHDFPNPDAHVDALRAMFHAYGRGAQHLFVKLDAWHTRALPLLRRAFPDTPWIFLYRDPVEVLVSHLRQRGGHTVPGIVPPEWFGLTPEDTLQPERDFIAHILAQTCRAALKSDRDGGLLVNYAELPEALFARILPHFGVAPDPEARDAMEAAAARNSKAPATRFRPDGETKQREADPDLRAVAERHLGRIYAALEARRIDT